MKKLTTAEAVAMCRLYHHDDVAECLLELHHNARLRKLRSRNRKRG